MRPRVKHVRPSGKINLRNYIDTTNSRVRQANGCCKVSGEGTMNLTGEELNYILGGTKVELKIKRKTVYERRVV
jgi:hypothetical protein